MLVNVSIVRGTIQQRTETLFEGQEVVGTQEKVYLHIAVPAFFPNSNFRISVDWPATKQDVLDAIDVKLAELKVMYLKDKAAIDLFDKQDLNFERDV